MEAAKLKKVEDRIDRGVNGLPSAGSLTGWIPKGTIGAGPAPTPAINSGKKLPFPATSSNVTEPGQGKRYLRDADQTLNNKGNGGLSEANTGEYPSNEF